MTGLVPFAVLVCTVEALRGATAVGPEVKAAPLEPDTLLLDVDGAKPVIGVYVGQEAAQHAGKLILEGKRRLELSLQIFLPESMSVEINGVSTPMDTRGLGAEVVFAAILRQAMRALQCEEGPWSTLWNRFVAGVHETVAQDFLWELPGKARGFAREVTYIAETADEPEYGIDPYPFWADFLDGIRGLKDYGDPVADLLLAEISAPPGLPSWRLMAASQGDAAASARPLGFGPFDKTEAGEAPPLKSTELDGEISPRSTSLP